MQLHRAREQFEAAGVELVLIGQASPRQARHFRDRMGLEPLRVLADDERASYRAAGLRRASVGQLVGPRSVMAGVKHGARSRVAQGRIIGDVAQLGGAAVIAPGGEVLHHQAAQNAGDNVDAGALLAAVR